MSNQTFFVLLLLGFGLIVAVLFYIRRSAAVARKNVELAKKLSVLENRNAALEEKVFFYNKNLR